MITLHRHSEVMGNIKNPTVAVLALHSLQTVDIGFRGSEIVREEPTFFDPPAVKNLPVNNH